MGRLKCKLEFAGILTVLDKIEELNINKNDACEKALKASKKLVNDKLYRDTNKSNFPSSGDYSHGALRRSIDNDYSVKWSGMSCEIRIGYYFEDIGLRSIYLMYGTARMKPAKKLWSDIYSPRTKKEIRIAQKAAFLKMIERSS